jgi:multidrug efflux pump subunit AcrA (membrane-fusion protein)
MRRGAGIRGRRASPAGAHLTLVAALLATACGGSSPMAPKPPGPPPPPVVITFTPESPTPGANVIDLRLMSSTASELALTLDASLVADLFGYGLDLLYDPAAIAFEGFEPGTFLDGMGITVTILVSEPQPGTVVIGQSRVGSVAGASGSGTMVVLRFTAVAPGRSTISIDNAGAFDSTGAEITLEFFGGDVTVPESSGQ